MMLTCLDNPKQIYHCDFPDCHRSFVRQDLCARHKERHTARGSQLLRKDTFNMHNLNPIVTAALGGKNTAPGKVGIKTQTPHGLQSPASSTPSGPGGAMSPHNYQSPASTISRNDSLQRTGSDDAYRSGSEAKPYDMQSQSAGSFAPPPRPSTLGNYGGGRTPLHHSPHVGNGNFSRPELRTQTSNISSYGPGSPYNSSATPSQSYTPTSTSVAYQTSSTSGFQSQQNFPPFSSLPPPEYPSHSGTPVSRDQENQYYNATSGQTPMHGVESTAQLDSRINGVTEAIMDQTPSYAIPMFGGEGYSRSPFAMADDFAAWLFNDNQFGPGGQSPMGYPGGGNPVAGASSQIGLQAPYFNYDPSVAGYLHNPAPPAHPMAVHSILDTTLPEAALSEDKRKDLIDLITGRFNETDHAPVKKQKEDILEGNKDDPNHVLSLHMMQVYISSYWVHFHPQLPILHKPTFNASTCPELLLLAIICLGASCLEKNYGHEVTQACSSLSNFLAWHLRWELFMDADFRPPAKLWIFQSLLLLEIFEKMYSTRPLHERAHIHHATTLTLMRRGSSLIGRSAMDSPPSVRADSGKSNSIGGVNTPDEWWNHWITNEATRRAAFAAFVMDSIHATMFGHSAVMVAHEMRLPLPCDEALWSATSSSEVGRVEASLHSNGVKQMSFLDGLKKTLNGQTVRTNSFGRTILMAGLLSVSWHMNQRDLQVSSLGVTQALGGRDKWRGSLTRAFDFWKQDFDSSLARPTEHAAQNAYGYSNGLDGENVFESRTVLHHLAHMAMHVDIVDCQIYAGAGRLLGRSITPQDYNGAQRRMKEVWAPTARARDATFYALRFLSNVMVSGEHTLNPNAPGTSGLTYSARDDFLLNRPWVLYFATLIVWSYGYALDGPIQQTYSIPTYETKVKDMMGYLTRVGGVNKPDDLAKLTDRNACLGLLIIMRDMFKKTRWELLHEASNLLTKCIEMLVPGENM
jgi:hypothetical protein